MSNLPKPEDSLILARVDFDLLPSYDSEIDFDLRRLFNERISGYYWVLFQDGKLQRLEGDKSLPKKLILVDSEHNQTIASLKFLSLLLERKLSEQQIKGWRVKVFIDSEEEDFIIFSCGAFYLKNYKTSWEKESKNRNALLAEIKKIEDLI